MDGLLSGPKLIDIKFRGHMKTKEIALPKIVSRKEWLVKRKELLLEEKEITRKRDELNAKRRQLPMVKIEKEYLFEGPKGTVRLLDLFEGRRQLLVHHFMYFDGPDRFCPGCSMEADQNYKKKLLKNLHDHDLTLAAVALAPLSRIEKEKRVKGWDFPFYSAIGTEFNYDFQATIKKGANSSYNYQDAKNAEWLNNYEGDMPAKSVFLRHGTDVFHTYSTYTRGTELVAMHYNYLDLTPYGRQEDWEDSPTGWPQKPTYG